MISRFICMFKGHVWVTLGWRQLDDGWYGGDVYRDPLAPSYELVSKCSRCGCEYVSSLGCNREPEE